MSVKRPSRRREDLPRDPKNVVSAVLAVEEEASVVMECCFTRPFSWTTRSFQTIRLLFSRSQMEELQFAIEDIDAMEDQDAGGKREKGKGEAK